MYVEVFLAHEIKKKIQQMAKKLLKTAQNHEIDIKVCCKFILLKEYVVNIYILSVSVLQYIQECFFFVKFINNVKKRPKNGPKQSKIVIFT